MIMSKAGPYITFYSIHSCSVLPFVPFCVRSGTGKENTKCTNLFQAFLVSGSDKKTLTLDKYFLLWMGLFDSLDLVEIETLTIFR